MLILLAGGTGSGKTTMAQQVVQAWPAPAATIAMDDYWLPEPDWRVAPAWDGGPGWFDMPSMLEAIATVEAATDLLVVEGVLALRYPSLRQRATARVWLEVSDMTRLWRRLWRDLVVLGQARRFPERALCQWRDADQPLHEAEVQPTAAFADVRLPGECTQLSARVTRLVRWLEQVRAGDGGRVLPQL